MRILMAILTTLYLAGPVQSDAIEVVLMVDVSRSMSERELEIQRRGYAEALRTDAIFDAVQSGLLQRVAMTYVEWAGTQQIVVDWRLLETKDDLTAFANTLTAKFDPALRRTSISGAIRYGTELLKTNAFQGIRQVIDISGDGPNNLGRPVALAREAAVRKGIVVNGLPLMTREGMGRDALAFTRDGTVYVIAHTAQKDLFYIRVHSGGSGDVDYEISMSANE